MKGRNIVIIALVFIIPCFAKAQCCSGGVPMSANLGLPPGNGGTLQAALVYDALVLNDFRTGDNSLNDKLRKRTTHSILLQTNYSLTERFSIESLIPWVRQERLIKNSNDFTATQGFGDAVLLLKFRLTSPLSTKILSTGIGVKVPTGTSDKKNSAGLTESADLQPGTGSFDAIFWTSLVYPFGFRPSLNSSISTTYKLNGENSNYLTNASYKFGNELQVVAGLTDRLIVGKLLFDPSLSLRFRSLQADEFNNGLFPNTGGKFLFLVSSLTFLITPKLSFGVASEVPLYRKVGGTQVSPSYRIGSRLFYTFNSKKDDNNLIN